jgi:hypothetical protein
MTLALPFPIGPVVGPFTEVAVGFADRSEVGSAVGSVEEPVGVGTEVGWEAAVGVVGVLPPQAVSATVRDNISP